MRFYGFLTMALCVVTAACSDNGSDSLSDESNIYIQPKIGLDNLSSRSVTFDQGIISVQLSELTSFSTLQQNTYDASTWIRVGEPLLSQYGDSQKDLFVSFPGTYYFRLYGNVNGPAIETNADIPAAFVGDKVISLSGAVVFNMRPVTCAVQVNLQDVGDNAYTGASATVAYDAFKQVKLNVLAAKDAAVRSYTDVLDYLEEVAVPQTFAVTSALQSSVCACNILPCTVQKGELIFTIEEGGKTYSIVAAEDYVLDQSRKYIFTIRLGVMKAEVVDCTVSDFVVQKKEEITSSMHIRYNKEKKVYEIFTPRGLKAFSDIVNGTMTDSLNCLPITSDAAADAVLMRHVDMYYYDHWTPIGTSTRPYTGTFDGNNKEVSYLRYANDAADNQGLFGVTRKDTVKNLNILYSDVRGNKNVGILVGQAYETVFENCVVSNSKSTTQTENAGAFVGYADKSTFTACSLKIDTLGSLPLGGANVGGFVGKSTESVYSECKGTGMMVVDQYSYAQVGGFVGSSNNDKYYYCRAGGSYLGRAAAIDNVGGFCGKSKDSDYICCDGYTGYIFANSNSASSYVGGFMGYSENDRIEASYGGCFSWPQNSASNDIKRNYVGGFVGYMDGTTIIGSRSTQPVAGNTYVGGFVGYMKSGHLASCNYTFDGRAIDVNPRAVQGYSHMGFFAGYAESGIIEYCSTIQTGTFVGTNAGATLTSCKAVWDGETIWNNARAYTGTINDGVQTYTMAEVWAKYWYLLFWQ